MTDDDHHVRIEAVRALVSVDDVAGVEQAGSDANREVRIAAANGLATLGGGGDVVRALLADRDPLVRRRPGCTGSPWVTPTPMRPRCNER